MECESTAMCVTVILTQSLVVFPFPLIVVQLGMLEWEKKWLESSSTGK